MIDQPEPEKADEKADEKTPKTPRVVTYIAVVASLAALFTGILAVVVTHNLRTNLIDACQHSRAPLQVFFQKQLVQQSTFTVKQLQDSFPEIPPKQLADSLESQKENLETLLATTDPGKCESQY